ncbi:TPA: LPXTG cell wall anchor domain-containing protein [Streptococcus equi subsp. zooepidemicus]|nr:LPXTG cell wall anchor domain-containing protein [Streptococcus equi subsp. zooepidemicus]
MNQLGTAKEARDKAQAEAERLGQAVDSLGRLTESAKRELTEKLAEIEQLTQDKAKAASDLEAANANITTLQEELAGAKASYDKLSEDKAAAAQALAEANVRVSELEQQVAAANSRVADLEAQLAAKTTELGVVKADKAELEAKVKELQDMLQQKDRSNADLQANIERLKQELADKFKDQAQPRSKTPQASNSVAKQKASKPTAKPAGQLPSTGEATANPFFTAAAVAIMTGAGLVTAIPKRQKN